MAKEIEHKYLVKDLSFIPLASSVSLIRQGYLCRDKERTVRIRVKDDKAFITIKGVTVGDTRAEYEYPIPVDDANEMLDSMCDGNLLEKSRYIVDYHGNKWEIDCFAGCLDGLVVAEIEIPHSDYAYDIPPFIGLNVTGDPRYYNSCLAQGKMP